jgi:hypothetical protein
MNTHVPTISFWFSLVLLLSIGTVHSSAQSVWTTVVNNGDYMPGTLSLFNSYSQPSVNAQGLVVFRARSKGGNGEPTHGIYMRNMLSSKATVVKVFDRNSTVPQPNNTDTTFIEFPSFPRVDLLLNTIATRGNSQPVWNYTLADGTDTKAGTSTVFSGGSQSMTTAVSQLGIVPGYERFQVPGAASGTRFDQFPGAPAITLNRVVFKGNYTESGISKTGVFFRDPGGNGGANAVQLIANSNTRIPNQSKKGNLLFGSTAPPSAALGMIVFAGFDNEDHPTAGGIYWALVQSLPTLRTLVGIGDQVPGEASKTGFTRFGESLAFDGRNVAFWGAWGAEIKTATLPCPIDGNADLVAYCNRHYPNGYTTTVPLHQGIFVYDTLTGALTSVAKSPVNFDDFLYWTFSGKVPGSKGSADGEPARWRSSAFASAAGVLRSFQVVFKAQKGAVNGIYAFNSASASTTTLVDTTMPGTGIDPNAPYGSFVTSVGIERESLRAGWLALTASMLDPNTSESWGGIYIRRLW